jgi:hypothetical protein
MCILNYFLYEKWELQREKKRKIFDSNYTNVYELCVSVFLIKNNKKIIFILYVVLILESFLNNFQNHNHNYTYFDI